MLYTDRWGWRKKEQKTQNALFIHMGWVELLGDKEEKRKPEVKQYLWFSFWTASHIGDIRPILCTVGQRGPCRKKKKCTYLQNNKRGLQISSNPPSVQNAQLSQKTRRKPKYPGATQAYNQQFPGNNPISKYSGREIAFTEVTWLMK